MSWRISFPLARVKAPSTFEQSPPYASLFPPNRRALVECRGRTRGFLRRSSSRNKNQSHSARESHSGRRPNRDDQKVVDSCRSGQKLTMYEEKTEGLTHPNSVFTQAFGVLSFGLPLKLTNLTPPQLSPPRPLSHFSTSPHARSFTALWIGTMTRMSFACGSWFLRAIAAKN